MTASTSVRSGRTERRVRQGRRVAVLAVLLAGLAASGCTSLGAGMEDMAQGASGPSGFLPQQRQPISFESAQQNDPQSSIGRSQHPRILAAYGGAYSDPRLERSLAAIVGRLAAYSDDPNRAYSITVLNSPNINAFALPGGYLYVTRGLLALANDSAEVAAVLAHEMGHVSANHGIKRQEREQAAELAGRVVAEVLSSPQAGQAALAKGQLNLASFSRNQELEADALGIRHIGRAGYDPYSAARFLEAMESFSRFRNAFQAPNADLDFLASHPASAQRIDFARRHAAEFGPEGTGIADRDRYLSGIDGMLFGDTAAEGYVRERSFFHPGLGITFTVPRDFVIDNTAEAVLATGPGDTAIRFDGVALPERSSLDDYVRSGWIGGLDANSIRPIRVAGLEGVTARAQGGAYVFDITLIRVGGQVYRFLTAMPANASDRLDAAARQISDSFRLMSPAERQNLKPLRIRIVTAGLGDTEASIAGRMQGVDRKVELFRLLNGLEGGGGVRTGTRYKIIAE
nr:M48 family metalloprotease [Aureimonas frigidaquae]